MEAEGDDDVAVEAAVEVEEDEEAAAVELEDEEAAVAEVEDEEAVAATAAQSPASILSEVDEEVDELGVEARAGEE